MTTHTSSVVARILREI